MARSTSSKRSSPPEENPSRIRLQRVMADAGVAARRICEQMIESGKVSVNGEVTRKLPVFVDPENDTIIVEGRPLQRPERKLYLMVFKPERMLVTNADEPEFDRATIMEIVDHPAKARLFPVGRLDFETAGLVLMTNDGDMANALSHPKFNVPKIYEALIRGHIDQALLDGVRLKIRGLRKRAAREDGNEGPVAAGPIPEFDFIRHQGPNSLVHISVIEAKNRELRDVLSFLGMPIKKLTRIGLGGLTLTGVAPAQWRELTREEIHLLRRPRGGFVAKPRRTLTPPPVPGAYAPRRPRPASPSVQPEAGHSDERMPPRTPSRANPNDQGDDRPQRSASRQGTGGRARRPAYPSQGDSMAPNASDGTRRSRPFRPAADATSREGQGDRPRFPRPSRPPSGGRPVRGSRPAPTGEGSDRPTRGDRPVSSDRPSRGERPVRSDRPTRAPRPTSLDRPARTDRPAQGDRSARPQRPDRPAGPGRPARSQDQSGRPSRPTRPDQGDRGSRGPKSPRAPRRPDRGGR